MHIADSDKDFSKWTHVFVYGSLKRGHGNHRLLGDPTSASLVAIADIVGNYKMMDFGPYPGLIRSKAYDRAAIIGEMYFISEKVLKALDILEGNGHYYTRVKVPTSLSTHAWCYFLPTSMADESLFVPNDSATIWRPTEEERAYALTLHERRSELRPTG